MRIIDTVIDEFETDAALTRRLIRLTPENLLEYRISPRHSNWLEIALLMRTVPFGVIDICAGRKPENREFPRVEAHTIQGVLDAFDESVELALAALNCVDDESASSPVEFPSRALTRAEYLSVYIALDWHNMRQFLHVQLELASHLLHLPLADIDFDILPKYHRRNPGCFQTQ